MDEIIDVLKKLKVTEYKVMETRAIGSQWYFIQDNLDISRRIQSQTFEVTIYQTIYGEKERYKGYASAMVNVDHHLEKTLLELVEKAKMMRNPYFDLPEVQEQVAPYPSTSMALEMMEVIKESFPLGEPISLTSYDLSEQFEKVHIVNSKGLDISYTYPKCKLQFALKYQGVSLFKHFSFGFGNLTELRKIIRQSKEDIVALSGAQYLTYEPGIPVMISREAVVNLMLYYVDLLSNHRQGEYYHLIPEGMKIEVMAYLENSSRNYQYDRDGRLARDVVLFKDNCLENYFGSYIDSIYFKKAANSMNNFRVSGGTCQTEDFESYLDIVELTDFNVDLRTGLYRGVIRLAYLHHEGKVTPMSHGVISGSLNDRIVLSKQLKKYDYAVVPRFVYLPKSKITA